MNVAVTTAAEGWPRRAFTVADISRMIEAGIIGDDEKFELIEGDIVVMAPRGIAHERIKAALIVAVARALPDDRVIGVEATLRLTDKVMVEPDIAVFPKAVFERAASGFARLDAGEAELVIEIAASSLAYDKGIKARLYARHGVKELWVVDANERITFVYTGPRGEAWSSIVQRGAQDTLTAAALPGLSVRLDAIG